MTKFDTITYIILNIAALILGADKVAFGERINLVNASRTKLKDAVKRIKDPDDRALAIMAYHQLLEAKAGVVHTPCLMDWCSSGASILSAVMRDPKGMQSCGVISAKHQYESSTAPGNLYQVLADRLNETLGEEFTRKEVKSVSVPYYYGGDANVRELMQVQDEKATEMRIQAYANTYADCLPGAAQFRQEALDAWPEDKTEICFSAPDGYQVAVPILGDTKAMKVEVKYPVKDDNGKTVIIKTAVTTHFKVPECRPMMKRGFNGKTYRNDHTKGLGAHLIHALDAYILREIVRMSKLTMAEAQERMSHLTTGFSLGVHTPEMNHVIEMWEKTGVINTRILYLVQGTDEVFTIPQGMYDQLEELIKYLPVKHYDVVHIHDEFGALPQHMDELRKSANVVYANLYRGRVADYYNEQFGMSLKAGEYDAKLYETLLNVDYLLS